MKWEVAIICVSTGSREFLSSDLILICIPIMMINTHDSVIVALGYRHERGVPSETHDDRLFRGG